MKGLLTLSLMLILLIACQNSGVKQTKDIIVYGSDNCDHCVDFKTQLDSIGYNFEFKDVEFNEFLRQEMIGKVRSSGVPGGFQYPVIDVEGTILIAPELEALLELM